MVNKDVYGQIKTAEERTVIQQYGDWCTAVDGWAVTFGTARISLGGLRPRPVASSLHQINSPPTDGQCTNFIFSMWHYN